jgi:hypothetical protein
MEPEVVVQRCTLTVRRRGGWGWGTDPRGVLERAVTGLDRMLAEAVTEAAGEVGLPSDGAVEVTEPLRLRVGADGRPDPASRAALVRVLAAAVGRTVADAPESAPVAPPAAPGAPPAPGRSAVPPSGPAGAVEGGRAVPSVTAAPDARRAAATMARCLGRWSRAGRLAAVAGGWPASVVDAWLAALHAAAAPSPADTARPAPAAAAEDGPPGTPTVGPQAVPWIAAAVLPEPATWSASVRELVLLGAVTAAGGDHLPPARTLHAVRLAAGGTAAPGAPASVPGPGPASSPPAVVPALPFLVLVALHRIGYLDGLVAAVGAAGLPDGPAVLAAALAATCLPAPDGAGRTPAESAAVLAVAALTADRLELGAQRPARDHDAVLAPLRSALTGCYADGPGTGEPLAVTAVAGGSEGYVLGEPAGVLPVDWVGAEADLAPTLAQLGGPPVRRADVFAGFAAAFLPRHAFAATRRTDLQRHLAAAVGTGLGSIALTLWPDAARAADAPLLALERLHDLEVRVETRDDGLTVGVPRGQRWLDLSRGGFLACWPIPWAPCGRWELVSW